MLAIVGGSLVVDTSEPGGTRVTVTLPATGIDGKFTTETQRAQGKMG